MAGKKAIYSTYSQLEATCFDCISAQVLAPNVFYSAGVFFTVLCKIYGNV